MDGTTWNDLKALVDNIVVDEEVLKSSNLVLFGAGMNGSAAYEKLKNEYSVYAFTDNDPKYRDGTGAMYEGLEVIVPEKLIEVERVFVVIAVTGHHYKSVKEQLQTMGIPYMTYMELVLKRNFHKFQTVYDKLLVDEYSKRTYLNLLMSHITCDMAYLREVFVRNQYFEVPEFNLISPKEIFVDCGAYVGDSMERYVVNRAGVFGKIYCFEPTGRICEALGIRRERLIKEWALEEDQIVSEQKLVSAKNERKSFANPAAEETANRIVKDHGGASEIQIEAVSLDAYFADKEKPSFIKADIEGSEMELIKGAEQTIRNDRPLLAICIYHGVDDLYEIPLKLAELNPDYKMSVRQHMPNYHETVLYCY